MPHWSARVIISFLFSPEVVIPVVLTALGIAFTVALAPTIRNVRLAHWFFAIAGIWACGGVLRWLTVGEVPMKYLISFFTCGLIGTLWLASYTWVEANHQEQAQQQDKSTESKPDKKDEGKKKEGDKKDLATSPSQNKNDKQKVPTKVSKESTPPVPAQQPTFSVTNPSGSIINQGTTVGAPQTVNNFGPPPLKLSEDQQAQITAFLKTNGITSGKVSIFVDGPTVETQIVAKNLAQALKDAGMDVTSDTGTLLPPQGTLIHPGISFDVTPETFDLANGIGKALIASHVVSSPVPSVPYKGSYTLGITIRKP